MARKIVCCLAAALALVGASCGTKNNLFPVSGKVIYNGAPASGAAVFFYRRGGDDPVDSGSGPAADQDGQFVRRHLAVLCLEWPNAIDRARRVVRDEETALGPHRYAGRTANSGSAATLKA